jgi:hypothetical protein
MYVVTVHMLVLKIWMEQRTGVAIYVTICNTLAIWWVLLELSDCILRSSPIVLRYAAANMPQCIKLK